MSNKDRVVGVFQNLFGGGFPGRARGRVFRASVRGAGVALIVEVRAADHQTATRKIERRYDGATVEWIHQKAA